ncbi:hypothetical protein [Prochlorococcus sp. MIT 1307]|uniref:hypothetical protein n=1 Tax=Prochlorococcus sp. MIT 1307 TaxID=3096219 RepID=UPI002A7632C2|nr:hypothetical protein [Prochlorococcus sp. MIT 1307]
MDSSFSSALELNGMSATTSLVVWVMIIFLFLLIFGILYYFKKELDKKKIKGDRLPKSDFKGKGF